MARQRRSAARGAKESGRAAHFRAAYMLFEELPFEVRERLAAMVEELCDLGDQHQIPPRGMAVGVAMMLGGFVLAEVGGNVHANKKFDEFVDLAYSAVHVAVAKARIAAGWKPADA